VVAVIDELYDLSEAEIARLHEDEIREHIAALDREFAGRVMDRKAKDLWNTLNSTVEEFQLREERIRQRPRRLSSLGALSRL
jgi:hypothetical protein